MKVEQLPNPISLTLDPLEAAKLKALLANIGAPDVFILELYGALNQLNIPEWRYDWKEKPCLR